MTLRGGKSSASLDGLRVTRLPPCLHPEGQTCTVSWIRNRPCSKVTPQRESVFWTPKSLQQTGHAPAGSLTATIVPVTARTCLWCSSRMARISALSAASVASESVPFFLPRIGCKRHRPVRVSPIFRAWPGELLSGWGPHALRLPGEIQKHFNNHRCRQRRCRKDCLLPHSAHYL